MKSNFKEARNIISKTNLVNKQEEEIDEENENDTIQNLEKLRGLPGVKFKFEQIKEK